MLQCPPFVSDYEQVDQHQSYDITAIVLDDDFRKKRYPCEIYGPVRSLNSLSHITIVLNTSVPKKSFIIQNCETQ